MGTIYAIVYLKVYVVPWEKEQTSHANNSRISISISKPSKPASLYGEANRSLDGIDATDGSKAKQEGGQHNA